MRINGLKQRLKSLKIDRDAYCLEGGLPDEAYTINQNMDTWEVYYSERGNKSGLKVFKTENEACEFFLTEIIKMAQ